MKLQSVFLYFLLFLSTSLLLFLSACGDDESGKAEMITAYEDNDDDGFGNPNEEVEVTELSDGLVLDNTDCDDTDASINPDATEIPDNDVDENCDGLKDLTWFEDADEDGFGNTEVMQVGDVAPDGFVGNNDDCDDTDENINPDADEIPDNDVDENCDGIKTYTWYEDSDGDGYGNAESIEIAAEQPTGYVSNDEDCNDNNELVNPDAVEIKGNDVDENCDGNVESAVCGDGVEDVGEECDDGGTTSEDGCSSTCTLEDDACSDGMDNDGDGEVDCNDPDCIGTESCPIETVCDDMIDNDGDGDVDCLDSDCSEVAECQSVSVCGNGITEPGEDCDDGNTVDGDECSALCQFESCGDGIVDFLEECDDGNSESGDGCYNCRLETETECSDMIDNDGDGDVDCDDSDCTNQPICAG